MITNCRKQLKIVLYFMMASYSWWVVFYPDLCLVKDVCSVIKCDREQQCEEQIVCNIDALDFLQADSQNICVKSKLIEWIEKNEKKLKDSDTNSTGTK